MVFFFYGVGDKRKHKIGNKTITLLIGKLVFRTERATVLAEHKSFFKIEIKLKKLFIIFKNASPKNNGRFIYMQQAFLKIF